VDRAIDGHFTASNANEQLVFMSGCELIGQGEAYLLSPAAGGALLVSREADARPDVRTFRRRDGRTGIALLAGFAKQGSATQLVTACAVGPASTLECETLFFGESVRASCPPERDPRTDVDKVLLTLMDQDGDGVSDISLRVEYSVWPTLTQAEAYKLALTTGCAGEVPSPPAERVPAPSRGTAILVYLNRADHFEATAETTARLQALGPQAELEP
jgi:hypothetical protein